MSYDDDTLNIYRKLFRVTTRAFYDPVSIAIVDYMVSSKNRGSITEDEIEQLLKIPKKRTREAFTRMKMDDIIKNNVEETRWTLNTDIRQVLKLKIEFLFNYVNQRKELQKYKCPGCNKEIDVFTMSLCKGICDTCKRSFESKESDNKDHALTKEALNKIKAIIHQLETGKREFDTRIYGEDYQKYLEKALEKQAFNDPSLRPRHLKHTGYSRHSLNANAIVDIKNESHIFACTEEPLYKKVLKKISEKKKDFKFDDNILKESKTLKEYYANHPSQLHKSRKAFDTLLKKRKFMARLSDTEYAKEYRNYMSKRILI